MSYINEPCGCDGNSQATINTSPILSGSQEAEFSPQNNGFSFLEGTNDTILGNNNQNNFSNNDESKQTYSLDDLISLSTENNTVDENKFSNNNIQQMNTQQNFNMGQVNPMGNDVNVNQMLNSNPNRNNNGMQQMNHPQDHSMMQNNMPTNVNPELQSVMNKLAAANQLKALSNTNESKPEYNEGTESSWRFIVKNFNIVLIVVIALAWSDVAKFYINRSIKFGGGNHKYYIYYAAIATVILYGTSKYIHHLN
jgi:hypothetical protein